jgi:N-acetylmuramoyl-L-alanine amidase
MDAPQIIDHPSPNHDARPAGRAIDMLVLHYTGMADAGSALRRLCDPAAKVSAHYLIDEDGTTYALVAEERRAWHAGVSVWAGETGVNDFSIGIELVNPGHEFGYRPFPEPQMLALKALALAVLGRHPIPPARVVGHSDVAPDRKTDPGELFDWRRCAAWGIGRWPAAVDTAPAMPPLAPGARGGAVRAAQSALAAFGYGLAISGDYDDATRDVVAAFQRHFRPREVDGVLDGETAAILATLSRA